MSKTEKRGKARTKVITGVVRLSYAHIWEPQAVGEKDKAKYSVSLIIPKSDKATIAKIEAAIQAAYEEGEGKLKGGKGKAIPPLSTIKTPLRDGDDDKPDDEAYANSMFLNARSEAPPTIVSLTKGEDGKFQRITDPNEVKSGDYARVGINAYAFNSNGSKGITFGLDNIQKVRTGERFGGKSSAESDFDDDFAEEYAETFDDDDIF
jgi:hypothetical protein